MVANSSVPLAELKLVAAANRPETILRITGPITADTSAVLDRRLRDLIPQFERVVLDISNVDYMDSFCVGVLAAAHTQARKDNCRLEIANPKPRLRERVRTWARTVFEGREEMLGMTPD